MGHPRISLNRPVCVFRVGRAGFTLFEVSLSLVLVAFGVVSVLMIFPIAIRQLTVQRYQAYASCIANQLIDVYGNADASSVYCDHEGPNAWDVSIDRKVNAPDLEMRCSNLRYGLLPLPVEIAKRLDSDGDEMGRLLDEGGYLYYVQPSVPTAWREDLLPVAPPNDLQRIVVGVVGSAQSNAATSLPIKRWPYYGTVPAPPLHAIHNRSLGWDRANPSAGGTPADIVRFEDDAMPAAWKQAHATYCWQACVDPDPNLKTVFSTFWDYLWIRDFPKDLNDNFRTRLGAYLAATIAYAASSQLTETDIRGLLDTPPLANYPYAGEDTNRAAKKVLALNYLAHALMCLTRWHKLDGAPDNTSGLPTLTAGVDIAGIYRIAPVLDLQPITHQRITNFTRNVRFIYFRFTADHPYNWAVPRPIEHATMMDYALLEADLFREPAAGNIWGLSGSINNPSRSGSQALQWKYLSPTPITTVTADPGQPLGANLTYPMSPLPGVDPTSPTAALTENGPSAGSRSHCTLLNRFEASERCRQLVFWVVDWQSYVDSETAPSAPVDAGRYPKAAPGGIKPANAGADGFAWDNAVAPCTTFDDLMWGFTDGWGDATGLEQTINQGGNGENIKLHRALLGSYVHAYRNPEKNLMFKSSVADLATGADISALKIHDIERSANVLSAAGRASLNTPPDYGPPGGATSAPAVFCGAFGADRNGNDRLDRGTVPASVRLRATTVARFNFYDLRVPCQIK